MASIPRGWEGEEGTTFHILMDRENNIKRSSHSPTLPNSNIFRKEKCSSLIRMMDRTLLQNTASQFWLVIHARWYTYKRL